MPACANDSKRHYTGTEPSPKGRGFCAHAERVGTRKLGKNRKMWVVSKTAGGTKRWVPVAAKGGKAGGVARPHKKGKVSRAVAARQAFVSATIREMRNRGYPHNQAVAIALRMAEQRFG